MIYWFFLLFAGGFYIIRGSEIDSIEILMLSEVSITIEGSNLYEMLDRDRMIINKLKYVFEFDFLMINKCLEADQIDVMEGLISNIWFRFFDFLNLWIEFKWIFGF